MEKDLDNTEKKTNSDDDDENIDSKKSSKNDKKLSDNNKKPERPASFFIVKPSGEVSEQKTEVSDTINHKENHNENVDNLTEDEVHEAIQIIIDEREQSVANELATTADGSVEELEAVADGLFLESLRHAALSEIEITPESIEQAYIESLEDLEIDTDVVELGDSFEVDTDDSILLDVTKDNPLSNDISTPPINNAFRPISSPPVPPQTPPAPRIGGFNNPPPPIAAAHQPNNRQNNPNTQNRNIIPVPFPVPIDSGSALLAGAITGYIIGRRNKKSNVIVKNNPPTNKKLEGQVKQLQTVIYAKESKLRTEVRKSIENTVITTGKPLIIVERRQKRIEIRKELKKREELVNNPKVEKIGNFSLPLLKIYRERRLPDVTENNPKRKPVEIMTVPELLEKSGHVKFEKWRIDELYKAHRITEKVLRQVTKEYMRGGPYKQTLTREVLPDPEIIAEKQKSVNDTYQKSNNKTQQGAQNRYDASNKEQKAQAIIQSEKSKQAKNLSKPKNALPLPWIALVTAIATITALALIYTL